MKNVILIFLFLFLFYKTQACEDLLDPLPTASMFSDVEDSYYNNKLNQNAYDAQRLFNTAQSREDIARHVIKLFAKDINSDLLFLKLVYFFYMLDHISAYDFIDRFVQNAKTSESLTERQKKKIESANFVSWINLNDPGVEISKQVANLQ